MRPNRHNAVTALIHSLIFLLATTASAQAGLVLEKMIDNATTTPVPGTTMGEQWARTNSAFDNSKIDNAGNLVFSGQLNTSGPGGVNNSNRKGIWYGAPGNWQLIARDGEAGPTLPGVPTGWWHNSTSNNTGLGSTPNLAPDGTLFISSQLNGTGAISSNNNSAFWTGQAGSIGIVAQRGFLPSPGGEAPGTAGALWNSNLNLSTTQFGVNEAGQVLFYSTLTGGDVVGTTNNNGNWIGSPSGIQLVLRKGQIAPNFGDPTLLVDSAQQFSLYLNNSGQVAFISKLLAGSGTVVFANTDSDQVLWTGPTDPTVDLSPVAREGDPLPTDLTDVEVPGGFYAIGDPLTVMGNGGLSNDGTLYYTAKIYGPTITFDVNDSVLISYNAGSTPQYEIVMQRNDPAPGLPGVNFNFWNYSNTRMNNMGTVLFGISLAGAGVTNDNDASLWVKPDGQPPMLVAREGDLINLPDLPPDATFTEVPSSSLTGLNDLDQVVFPARFVGTGIEPFGSNSAGIFAWDPVGGLMLIARTGEHYDGLVDVASQISIYPHSNGSGSCSGFNDNGWLALRMWDTLGNIAVFRTQVVSEGACCYTEGGCALTSQADCPTGALWHSDWAVCPVECPPVGSCCYLDGTCEIRFEENCSGDWTEGGVCEPNTCALPGACCNATTGECDFIPEPVCVNAETPDNIWHGGVTCDEVQCLGSCCDPTYGTCMESLLIDCPAPKIWSLGGTCTPNLCTQPTGSCCLTNGSCEEAKTRDECQGLGSVHWTPGAACGDCPEPPSLIRHGLSTSGTGISPDGQTMTSALYHGDTETSGFHKYTRGVGYSDIPGEAVGGVVRCTDGASFVATEQKDTLNCSGLSPAGDKNLAQRWTLADGLWAGLGSTCVPPGAGQCDFTINSTNGLSDDGRYVVVSGWSGGTCGPFRAWRFDHNFGGSWSQLPLSATGTANRAYAMSGNGNVIVGWDQSFGFRNAVVWEYSFFFGWTNTVLDPSVGQSEVYGVNYDGSVIVGYMSPDGMQAAFGTTDQLPIKWTKSGNNWIRTNLGGNDGMLPIAVSDDGNTVVGVGGTASDAWIWKPTLGAPMDLKQYLEMAGADPAITDHIALGAPLSRGLGGMSRDGNAVIGSFTTDDPCLVTFGGLLVYLDGTGIPCEPPRIVYQPVSQYYGTPPFYGAVFNCLAGGSMPMTYAWEKEDPENPGTWLSLEDDNCGGEYLPEFFQVHGSQGPQLRIGWPSGDLSESIGNYRCVMTNACGTVTSDPATLSMGGACCFFGDFCTLAWESNDSPLGCAEMGGVYAGDETTCGPTTCELAACCSPTGSCFDTFEIECQAPGVWHAGEPCGTFTCPVLKGDMNCDGKVDGLDVQAFVLAVLDSFEYFSNYPDCDINLGDINDDFSVDLDDLPGFVSLLVGP